MINHLLDYFKILLFAFKAVHGIAATYIQNLGAYDLRSSTFRTKVTLGDRSFQGGCAHSCGTLYRASFAIFLTCILLRAILRRTFLSLLIVE